MNVIINNKFLVGGSMKEKVKAIIKKVIYCILNPRFLICFGIAWMITNGWSYIMLAAGTYFGIKWMIAVSGAYLTFLWLPSPEKIVTLLIAMFLLRLLFPNDEKTLGVLREAHNALKIKHKEKKEKRAEERKGKKAENERDKTSGNSEDEKGDK